jgi:hypothetical protein
VPDFVARIALTADEVIAWLEARGWRLALSDRDLNSGDSFGGDDRFDIYLEDFRAGDGHRVVETCRDLPNGARHCAGYFVMENDFAGASYSSLDEAIRVLVSHEYFHTVQDAYQANIPAWWSEGTATWFQEAFDPSQSDFEALASLYFRETSRSLIGPISGPADSFSYATSLFVYFIALHIGDDGMRGIFERLGQGQPLLAAINAALSGHFDGVGAAFRAFAAWNALTATRAVPGFGYPQAATWRGLTFTALNTAQPFNWDRQVDALATDYAALAVAQPALLAIEAVDGWRLTPDLVLIRVHDDARADGVEVTYLKPTDPPTRLTPGPRTYVALVNTHTDGKAAGRVTLRLTAPSPPDPDPDPDPSNDASGGASKGGGCHVAPTHRPQWTGALPWLIFAAAACAASTRRRAHPRAR